MGGLSAAPASDSAGDAAAPRSCGHGHLEGPREGTSPHRTSTRPRHPGHQARRCAGAVRRLRDRPLHRGGPRAGRRGRADHPDLSELEITLFDRITSEQLDEAVIQVALQNVKDDPAFDTIAARLLVKTLYKQVLGDTHDLFARPSRIADLHREHFAGYIERGVDSDCSTRAGRSCSTWSSGRRARPGPGRPAPLHRRADPAHPLHDHRPRRRRLEVPQYFWMRVAMGLSLSEADPTAAAIGSTPRCPSWSTWLPAPPWSTPAPPTPSCPTASSCRWRTTSSTSPSLCATSCG